VIVAGSALEAAEAALCAAQKSGALHPPQIVRALAQGAHEERSSVLAAWERLERTRSRLRSGAWALYALPPPAAGEPAAESPDLYGAGVPSLSPTPSPTPEQTAALSAAAGREDT
jgi:hypothetical protein